MSEIITAAITGCVTLLGVLLSNRAAQAVTDEKLTELTREVREHNHFARRVPVVEEQIRGMLQGLYIVFMHSGNGTIYKVAALDPASITVNWAAMPVTATGTLALYEPDFGADGSLSLGSKVGDNVITALVADTELDMTAVVYLSGDAVDSTVFSATQGLSLNGGVNLQFASSVALTPMDYDFTAAPTKRKDG